MESVEVKKTDAVAGREKWIRRAMTLSWFTVAYNILEGIVSIFFGVSEGSFALLGFGADSLIEVGSASLIIWRFKDEQGLATTTVEVREKRAVLGIGILFVLLAAGTTVGAVFQLYGGSHPETTMPGVVISLLSLSFMFYLWRAKVEVASRLGSLSMKSDASCSLVCIKLSVILFAGSLLFVLAPRLWWADSTAAIVLSIFIGREGWNIIQAARRGGAGHCCSCGDS